MQTTTTLLQANQLIDYVYLPIIIWTILMIIYLGFLTIKFTFGNWTPENPNPYINETMALPRGVLRGILTLTLLFGVLIFEIYSINNPLFEKQIDQFMIAFQMMLAFYFGSKVMHHMASNDKAKALAGTAADVEKTKVSTGAPAEGVVERPSEDDAEG